MLSPRIVCLIACLLSPALLFGAEKDADKKAPSEYAEKYESVWMKRKLQASQQIMEALSRGDLEVVNRSARTMRVLSKIEGWARRSNTKEYRRQLRYFDAANQEIITQSEKDNLPGATLAFTQMTISCVSCHQHLRDVK